MWVTQVLAVAALTCGAASGHVTAEKATDGTATEGGGIYGEVFAVQSETLKGF